MDQVPKAGDMRILHLNTERTWRGGERQTLYTLVDLRDAGVSVELLARNGSPLAKRAKASGLTVHTAAFPAVAFLWLVAHGSRYNLLHAQTAKTHSLAVLSRSLHRRPVVYTRRVNFGQRGPFETWKYRRTARVVAISNAIRETLQRGTGLRDIPVIHSTYRERQLDRTRAKKLLADLGVAGKTVIATTGDLVPQKDPETMIEAVARILVKQPETVFLHFGNDQMGDLVRARIKKHQLEKRVFLLGHMNNVEDFFSIFDLYLVSSNETEGLLSAVLDAFLYRVPVASTLAGGLHDSVEGRALTVPPRDPEALANAALELLDNRELRESFVDKAAREVRELFGPERHVNDYLSLYREVLQR